jgi:hypothetical protein
MKQMGVRSKGGVEPMVRAIQRATDLNLPINYEYLHTLDFSNAFHKASRPDAAAALRRHGPELFQTAAFVYSQPTSIVVVDSVDVYRISSASGFRQGDPLSPLLFSLSIRQTLEDLQRTLEGHSDFLLLSHLDDIAILSNDPDTTRIVQDFLDSFSSPLFLNLSKSITTSFDDIRANGIEVLGTAVGSTEFKRTLLQKKIEEQENVINQLP